MSKRLLSRLASLPGLSWLVKPALPLAALPLPKAPRYELEDLSTWVIEKGSRRVTILAQDVHRSVVGIEGQAILEAARKYPTLEPLLGDPDDPMAPRMLKMRTWYRSRKEPRGN